MLHPDMKKSDLLYGLLITLIISSCFLLGCTLPEFDFNWSTQAITPAITPLPTTSPKPVNTTTTTPPFSTDDAPSFTVPAESGITIVSSLPNLSELIAQVRPSVVMIKTSALSQSFFGFYNQEGEGSGWIISPDGYIVTNNHVVEGAETITVILDDGRNFTVDNVYRDRVSDLAVLKIKAQGLPALKVGNSSVSRVGDWVIAIGNSLGQGIRATFGIISAKDVSIETENGETLDNLLDIDAAINAGNSGGPLINMSGEVIGINSIKVAQVGVDSMGYAISTQTAIPIINDLIQSHYVARPWLGVKLYEVGNLNAVEFKQLNVQVSEGVLLTTVVVDGPAYKAGLTQYDVITAVDDVSVSTVDGLVRIIRNYEVGDIIRVTYWRGPTQKTVQLILEQSQS